MSLADPYFGWTITPVWGGGGSIGPAGAGVFRYRLEGTGYDSLQSGENVRTSAVRVPTTAVPHQRQRVMGGPGVEIAPRRDVMVVTSRPADPARFQLTFSCLGLAVSPIPLSGTFSTPSMPSRSGAVSFFGSTRRAADFNGEGHVVEWGAAAGTGFSVQIMLIGTGLTLLGGPIDFARRVEEGLRQGAGNGPVQFLRGYLTPQTALAMVSGQAHGGSVGVTIYVGIVSGSDRA